MYGPLGDTSAKIETRNHQQCSAAKAEELKMNLSNLKGMIDYV